MKLTQGSCLARKLWIDCETRGPNFSQGLAVYAQTVEVIMVQWAVDDGPIEVIDMTRKTVDVGYLFSAALKADEIWAHEAAFDRTMLGTTDWWPKVPLEKWRCTAALARMHGLPGGLDKLCQIFKVKDNETKQANGRALIQLFCKPCADGSYNDRQSRPTEWTQFLSYGGADVSAMRAVWHATPKWNATACLWAGWHLNERMNDRGVGVDLELCEGAKELTAIAKERMSDRTLTLTQLEVERTTQVARLRAYMAEYGVHLPDLTADTVERRLEDESLPEHIKELLRVRQQASKSSSAKYSRALNQQVDGRLRNLLIFCGAARTGRWAGRTFQPHNLPRPKHPQWEIDLAIELFRRRAIDLWDPDDTLGLASSCLRGIIVAGPGRKLVASDLKNIEGRIIAWVAGEEWKLKAFEDYDNEKGPDLYKIAYARAFNIDPSTIGDEDPRRQIGKVLELALQYYGGVGAFCSMAETYGLRLEDLAKSAWPIIPANYKQASKIAWDKAVKRKRTYGLEERIWMTCHALVLMWRAAHPAICNFWGELDQACQMALQVKGKSYAVGSHIYVDRQGNWLRIRLPSGRYLNYPAPRGDEFSSSFMGVDPYTKQWKRLSTYSGKRAQNIAEGIGADIILDGLRAADCAGYNPILSVHDEVLTEPLDDDKYNDRYLSDLLAGSSSWARGIPLAAKGFTSARYRK
jgi:DNA polymerase